MGKKKKLKINFKKLDKIKLLLKKKRKKVVKYQINKINKIKKITLKKSAKYISKSVNKAYENFKKNKENRRLKKIKLQKKEK